MPSYKTCNKAAGSCGYCADHCSEKKNGGSKTCKRHKTITANRCPELILIVKDKDTFNNIQNEVKDSISLVSFLQDKGVWSGYTLKHKIDAYKKLSVSAYKAMKYLKTHGI